MRRDDTMPAVLAIHGAGGGGWEWAIWQRVWRAEGCRLDAPDLQPAASGLAQTRLADYIAQMREAAAAHVRPVLIGASLGGLIALALAHDIDAAALVLVDPVPPAGIGPRPAPRRSDGAVVTWGSRRRLDSTRRALFDADAAAQLFAFRRWRDESAAVLADADAGIEIVRPRCPVLVIAAGLDEAIPTAASRALAGTLGATFWLDRSSHVGALLGRPAAGTAVRAQRWIQAETIHTDTSQVPPGTE